MTRSISSPFPPLTLKPCFLEMALNSTLVHSRHFSERSFRFPLMGTAWSKHGDPSGPSARWRKGEGANYWVPLTRKQHTMPHSAQPQHTNDWAPRTRKRHQQEHRPQRPTERSDPTQHAKGRTGDCLGPRKGATTRRNVTPGGGGGLGLLWMLWPTARQG